MASERLEDNEYIRITPMPSLPGDDEEMAHTAGLHVGHPLSMGLF